MPQRRTSRPVTQSRKVKQWRSCAGRLVHDVSSGDAPPSQMTRPGTGSTNRVPPSGAGENVAAPALTGAHRPMTVCPPGRCARDFDGMDRTFIWEVRNISEYFAEIS